MRSSSSSLSTPQIAKSHPPLIRVRGFVATHPWCLLATGGEGDLEGKRRGKGDLLAPSKESLYTPEETFLDSLLVVENTQQRSRSVWSRLSTRIEQNNLR